MPVFDPHFPHKVCPHRFGCFSSRRESLFLHFYHGNREQREEKKLPIRVWFDSKATHADEIPCCCGVCLGASKAFGFGCRKYRAVLCFMHNFTANLWYRSTHHSWNLMLDGLCLSQQRKGFKSKITIHARE